MKNLHFMGWMQNRGILIPKVDFVPPPPCYYPSYAYGRVFVRKFTFMLYIIFPEKIKKGNSQQPSPERENYKS